MKPEEVTGYLTEQVGAKLKRALTILEIEAVKSVKKNFDGTNRLNWTPWARSTARRKKPGAKLLLVSGNLSNISAERDEQNYVVRLMSHPLTRAYARAHQEGATITHPARVLRFRKSKTGRTVFASSKHKRIIKTTMSKPYTVKLPPRPWMVIPENDLIKIVKEISNEVQRT